MTNLMQSIFGKKQESRIPAPGSEGTLLALFLSTMSQETIISQTDRYKNVLMNLEFGLFVPLHEIDLRVSEAVERGFTPWANVDATSAFLYGAGYIEKEDFTPNMTWLRTIANPGDKAYVGIHNPGKHMQQIVIDL